MAAESLRKRSGKDKSSNPTVKSSKTKKEKDKPGGINKWVAVLCAVLLTIALVRVLYIKPNNLTSQSYLPLVYPECCTGSEEQLTRLWGTYRPQVGVSRCSFLEPVVWGCFNLSCAAQIRQHFLNSNCSRINTMTHANLTFSSYHKNSR